LFFFLGFMEELPDAFGLTFLGGDVKGDADVLEDAAIGIGDGRDSRKLPEEVAMAVFVEDFAFPDLAGFG
jgi:hypothetical protein